MIIACISSVLHDLYVTNPVILCESYRHSLFIHLSCKLHLTLSIPLCARKRNVEQNRYVTRYVIVWSNTIQHNSTFGAWYINKHFPVDESVSGRSSMPHLIEAEWRIYASIDKPSLVQMMPCRMFGAKPLSELMLTYSQLNHQEYISVTFHWRFKYLCSSVCMWKCRLQYGYHFIWALTCWFSITCLRLCGVFDNRWHLLI